MLFKVSILFQRKCDQFPVAAIYNLDANTSKEAIAMVMPLACREYGITKREIKKAKAKEVTA